ncbi:uncharacterized protein PG998_015187, partial [Apiospora kogelbergensis]|uniref:uncharacterized protein n=1 Tax=Apiospora kogelbergensis TaxID=1337665 RepID=UPI00312EA9BB
MASQVPTNGGTPRQGNPSNPTGGPDVLAMIRQLQERINELAADNEQLTDQVTAMPPRSVRRPGHRLAPPQTYDGKEGTVHGFLTQMKAYLRHYAEEFESEPDRI